MPMWDRRCVTCDNLWEVMCKIQEKDDQRECPECGSIHGEWMCSAPAVQMQSTRFMNTDKRTGFGDVIQKIQAAHPRTQICER